MLNKKDVKHRTPDLANLERVTGAQTSGTLLQPLTFPEWLCLHLQSDLDEVHGRAQADGDHTGHHAGQ